jgi:N6-adenosine-specific RNA methylase IME4
VLYDIVYADFPWPYTSFGTAKLPYKQMSEEEIAAFDWSDFCAKRCAVFAWITGPKMDLAFRCFEAWKENHGLVYQGIAFSWIKTSRATGKPIGASGPRPRCVKQLDEWVAFLSTHPNERVFPLLTESMNQRVFAPKARRGEHSKKPPEIRDRIVELYGDRSRIELFARGSLPEGWDGYGDEYEP